MPAGSCFFNRKGSWGVAQGSKDGFGGLAVGEVGGVDADVGGVAVEGFALAVEFFEGAAWILGLQEGAFAASDALVEVFGAGVEPDNGADLAEDAPVFFGKNHTTACGHDEADAADQTTQGGGL